MGICQGDGKRYLVAVAAAVRPKLIGGIRKAVAGLKMSGLSVDCDILHVITQRLSQELTNENEIFVHATLRVYISQLFIEIRCATRR